MVVVFTKQDITEVRELTKELKPLFVERGYQTLVVSAVTRAGLPELVSTVAGELDRMRQA
jgi:putative ribosome biogenesis GTPase RsgA